MESEVDTNKIGPLLHYRSRFISIPISSEGTTDSYSADPYFGADMFLYHGFSGGPIIRNNKLIGVIHGYKLQVNQTLSREIPYYLKFQLQIIRSSYIMTLLRRFEQTRL